MRKDPRNTLKPFNHQIQVCPICNKIDVYLNDGHNCDQELIRQESIDSCAD